MLYSIQGTADIRFSVEGRMIHTHKAILKIRLEYLSTDLLILLPTNGHDSPAAATIPVIVCLEVARSKAYFDFSEKYLTYGCIFLPMPPWLLHFFVAKKIFVDKNMKNAAELNSLRDSENCSFFLFQNICLEL